MKSIIVCKSVSHGNTRKVAETIGEVLDARVVDPADIEPEELSEYRLVGFGSGVRHMNYYPELREFVQGLPKDQRAKAFVFNTSGFPQPPFIPYRDKFVRLVEDRGFDVVDTFTCFGYDTYLPLRVVGGVRKGHPNSADLDTARAFARQLRNRVEAAD
ncbi:flavodoxin family protein [Rhodococcus sp. NPDC058521]|uniref:flavodoxin family protein n=1 Tax=Rhodococcus sp. NPDC058521 TaxID=3346536 RepID=UPI00364A1A89